MKFQPRTEAELADSNLIPAGEYPFEITQAADTTSKAGNEMIKLWVHVVDNEGRGHGIWDYLVSSVEYKVRHCAEAIGMLPEYEQGELVAEQMVGCTGKCKVGIQPEKDGYPAKNIIKDYVKRTTPPAPKAAVTKPKPAAAEDLNDSIPF